MKTKLVPRCSLKVREQHGVKAACRKEHVSTQEDGQGRQMVSGFSSTFPVPYCRCGAGWDLQLERVAGVSSPELPRGLGRWWASPHHGGAHGVVQDVLFCFTFPVLGIKLRAFLVLDTCLTIELSLEAG